MAISINSSQTTSVKMSLSDSLKAANIAATKMATGDAIIEAHEGPTALTIGLKMRSDLEVLQTVLKGIEQSKSMLNLAEVGARSIYNTMTQMKQILTQAKLGYMTDDLIRTTLSPTYTQLKAEINRIADSVSFNGQTLLNGQGGKQIAGQVSDVSNPDLYVLNGMPEIELASVDGDFTATAATVTGGTPGIITFTTDTIAPTVIGGTVTTDASGNLVVSDVKLVFTGITATDSTLATPKTAEGTLTIENVTLTFNVDEFTYDDNGTITSIGSAAPEISDISASNISFDVTDNAGGINAISGFTSPASITITDGTDNSVSNLTAQYALSGGVGATSSFAFVTGDNLATDIINLAMPNMRLTSNEGVYGMIDTLNTNANILADHPTNLTDLMNTIDANTDIPLMEALLDTVVAYIDEIGAYETRLMNIQMQLQTNVAEVDNAQGVFLNADLADETGNFTKANVQINIAISVLRQMNDSLAALKNLVG